MIDYRAKHRTQVHPLFLPFHDKLCERLDFSWQPYSSDRTFEAQDKIFALGRMQDATGRWVVINKGLVETNARAGESPHNYSCAEDWTKVDSNGKFIWLKKDRPEWAEFIEAVESVGLRSGKQWGDVDHAELKIACSWKNILSVHRVDGMDAAYDLIKKQML